MFIFIQIVLAAFTEDDKLTMAVRMLQTVEEDIPKYKTRVMRRVFQKQINNLQSVNIPKYILRYMYCTLTGDNSARQHHTKSMKVFVWQLKRRIQN